MLNPGDASTTRGDFYFGDNLSFNETLFDQARLYFILSYPIRGAHDHAL